MTNTVSTPMLEISIQHLKAWEKCPKKFELDVVERLGWQTNPKNFALGLTVHRLMEMHAAGIPVESVLPTVSTDVAKTYDVLLNSPWSQLEVVASEWAFSLKVALPEGTVWIDGRLDRLSKRQGPDGTEQLVIIDWKTGTAIPHNPKEDWQTLGYLVAVYELRHALGYPDLQPQQLSFAYVQVSRPGFDLSVVDIAYSAQAHQQAMQRLSQLCQQLLTAQQYPLPKACPDSYCPYSPICGIRVV